MTARTQPGSKKRAKWKPVAKKYANRQFSKTHRLDLEGDGRFKSSEINKAEAQIRATRLAPIIEEKLARRSDAVKRLSVLLLMVGLQMTTWTTGHQASIADVTRAINKLPAWRLRELGSPDWTLNGSYDRVQRLIKQLSEVLAEGWTHQTDDDGPPIQVDLEYYQRQVMLSDIPRHVIEGAAVAIDGTAMETCARFHSTGLIDLDGDYSKTDDEAVDYAELAENAPKERKAAVLGIGEDKRNIYTHDSEARAGHRTSTSKRKGGPFVGRECHLGVTVASIEQTNGVDKIKFNDEIPHLVVAMALVPAGAHRGKSVLPGLANAHKAGHCTEVVADGGYSLAAEHFLLALRKEGIPVTFRPASHQLGVKGFGDLLLIDGYPFAAYTPDELLSLQPPGYGATRSEKEAKTEKFNARARFRYATHGTPKDGTRRLISPLASGKVRSRAVPKSMRKAPNAPLVTLPAGIQDKGTVKIGVDEIATLQPTVPFTTAHNRAYGRRQQAETVNSRIKGGTGSLTDIEKGYTLLMNTAKIGLFLAHTISRHNQIEYRNHVRNREALEEKEASTRKRRHDAVTRTSDLESDPPNASDP